MPRPIPIRPRSPRSARCWRNLEPRSSPGISMCAITGVIDEFVAAAAKQCGAADILVNAAGTTAEQPVSGHSDELWLKIIDTNLNGAFRMMRKLLPGMIERRWGRIINIGSTAASVGWKDNPAYCASKSGLSASRDAWRWKAHRMASPA